MAGSVTPTITPTPGFSSLAVWALTTANPNVDTDRGYISIPGARDRSIQVFGTFGGATVAVVGSNDGVNWNTLHDESGVALTFTATDAHAIVENFLYISCGLSTAGTGAAITASILSGRTS